MKKFIKNIGNFKKAGFTLVELLIVITILAILSVAVLSTLNPIEQANKATDSRYKNDAAEVLSAFERYYASKQEYPWMDASFSDEIADATLPVGLLASSAGAGICGNAAAGGSYATDNGATCADDGILITADELKTTFRNKSFMTTTKVTDKIYIWKNTGSAAYVCYVPKAKTNRTASTNNPLYGITFTGGVPSAVPVKKILNTEPTANGDATHCPGLNNTTEWTALATACFVCVP